MLDKGHRLYNKIRSEYVNLKIHLTQNENIQVELRKIYKIELKPPLLHCEYMVV